MSTGKWRAGDEGGGAETIDAMLEMGRSACAGGLVCNLAAIGPIGRVDGMCMGWGIMPGRIRMRG